MKVCFSLFFFSAVTFHHSFAYEASYVDVDKECIILSPARCPTPCNCEKKHITFNPKTWYRAFIQSIKGAGCKCDKCQKTKKVKCKNGVCDTKNQKCACDYCWVGEVCEKSKNEHVPVFVNKEVKVTITRTHPLHLPVTTVTATDGDAKFCNGGKCPCGDVVYKLLEGHNLFTINGKTGAVSIAKPPGSSKYTLKISAVNILDGEPTKGDSIVVHITVNDESDANDDITFDMSDTSHDAVRSHHRGRRSAHVNVIHPLVIFAKPELNNKYYFNKYDRINFTVHAQYNGSSSVPVTSLRITATSVALDIISIEKGDFTSATTSGFEGNLNQNQKLVGKIYTSVKDTIGPLENLNLDLSAVYDFDGDQGLHYPEGVKSSPIVYGVYPEVNLTSQVASVDTFDDIPVQMNMNLPLLNYHLVVELTTNVECFVFMELKDVTVHIGTAINNSYPGTPDYTTSENSNGLNDRVVIDFGNITVSDGNEDRLITIDYTIGVKDHANVANGSTHYAGAGLQAGPSVLWVEQQNFTITKDGPALEVTINESAINNASQLYIGDIITIQYMVDHASTSEDTARDVEIFLISPKEFLMLDGKVDQSDFTEVSPAKFKYKKQILTLEKGKIVTSSFVMEVRDNITPLTPINLEVIAEYGGIVPAHKLFPVKLAVTLPLIGTPTIAFNVTGESGVIVFGQKVKFELTVQLNRMRSPLKVEIVLPKVGENNETKNASGQALMHILSMEVVHVGNNIVKDNDAAWKEIEEPRYFSTSENPRWKDQAVWNLPVAKSKGDDMSNSPENQIKIQVEVMVNEIQNLKNLEKFKLAAGVIGLPKMVWIGQVDVMLLIERNRQPRIDFKHTITNEAKDTYEHLVEFKHNSTSDQYAYNVTFEYYLPPYVQYLKVITATVNSKNSGIQKMEGDAPQRARFRILKPLTFMDIANHSIQVTLNRKFSPKTGKFTFMVPCALTYTNYEHKRFQYWKSVTRDIHVKSRAPVIERKKDAHQNYYGRGIYLDLDANEIYVCMNMHLPTARPACYKSSDSGVTWTAMDSRVGSVIGKNSKNGELYAVGRNQIVVIKYDESDDDWYLLTEKQKGNLVSFFQKKNFNDFTDVDTLDSDEIKNTDAHMDASKKWGATDEWLYYRKTLGNNWEKKAKWRL